jgi:hypothetical protein
MTRRPGTIDLAGSRQQAVEEVQSSQVKSRLLPARSGPLSVCSNTQYKECEVSMQSCICGHIVVQCDASCLCVCMC